MNTRNNGANQKPPMRNQNHSARGEVVRQGKTPVKNAVKRPANTPVKKPVQKTVPKPAQKPVQQPVRKTVQKQNQKAIQKPGSKKKTQDNNLVKFLVIGIVAILLILVSVRVYLFYKDETELLIPEVIIEAGSVRPDINMYFKEEPAFPDLVNSNLNFDDVNIDLPQTISFNIQMYGRNFPCKLIITDTVPPVGQGIPQKIFACDEIPDAASCVTGIDDITDVAATWKDVPDMSEGGNFTAVVLLTDGCGNETTVDVPFEVTKDSEAPVIVGALDMEVYIGDTITYKDNIIVTDDYDENPTLTIDTSNVDVNEEGTYEVTYTATDFSGNESSVTINLKLSEKPEGYVEPEVLYAEAQKILDEITEPGMTDEEIALQICWWCRYNIRFILRTETRSWTEAAYNAFIYRTGNCYSTAYAAKALYDVAGFENMIIERYPYQTATHFWNYVKINGQWYHCDSTWREGYDSYFFMYTTEELLNFWDDGWNGFQFKQELYPESATESVQYRIDYKNHTIDDP